MPTLPGRKPFGGHILSHDFVEAALLRRAGWAIHMMPGIEGSYEEGPPSLADVAVRDRRWCQGNLQHAAVLPARGLHWVSRLHLMMGIGAYGTAPLWLGFLLTGIMLSLEARFIISGLLSYRPVVVPALAGGRPGAVDVAVHRHHGRAAGPQTPGHAGGLIRGPERRAFGGGGRLLASVLVETVLAGLIAPVAMLTQSAAVVSILAGRDGGWQPQRRDDGVVPWRDIVRAYLPHTVAGVMLGVASALVSLPLLLWMTPVVLGLALAIPLAGLSARRSVGAAAARLGLLGTPEERGKPPVLAAVGDAVPHYVVPSDPVADLFRDPDRFAAHRAMLPPPRSRGEPYDPALLIARAKLDDVDSFDAARQLLSRTELAAALGDAPSLGRLQNLAHGPGAA